MCSCHLFLLPESFNTQFNNIAWLQIHWREKSVANA